MRKTQAMRHVVFSAQVNRILFPQEDAYLWRKPIFWGLRTAKAQTSLRSKRNFTILASLCS